MDATIFDDLLPKLAANWQPLKDKPEETPELTLRALWFLAVDEPRSLERARNGELPTLNTKSYARLCELVGERVKGVPLAHLTGRQCFMGLEMLAGPEALAPRKETELLGYAALERLKGLAEQKGCVSVVDLCTGVGNLALALASHGPDSRIYAADLSPDAVELARRNAAHLGLHSRVDFRVGDLFAPFDDDQFVGNLDMVICNPPYISSQRMSTMPLEISRHEPLLAFNGGPFGLTILHRLIAEAPRYLVSGGWLCFEVGLGQADHVRNRLQRNGHYGHIDTRADPEGNIRVLLARHSA